MNRRDKRLGMGQKITRRDFAQATLLGAGAMLLSAPPPLSFAGSHERASTVGPDWYGYGGVGDYAASHGNTPEVVSSGHRIRDGHYKNIPTDVVDTGEVYDLVIVGAGMSGLGAALEFRKQSKVNEQCLILDNHPIFGGVSKRNEFNVDGHKLIAPQGANGFSVPKSDQDRARYADDPDLRYMRELGIPLDFEYADLVNANDSIQLATDNYGYQYWQETTTSVARYFQGKNGDASQWVLDPMKNGYKDMPISETDKEQIANWRNHNFPTPEHEEFERWLDSMSYKQYLEEVLGFSEAVTRWADPIMAGGIGLGCDAISAYGAMRLGMPVRGEMRSYDNWQRNSLPGGNDGFARHFVKKLIPTAISGGANFEDIINGQVQLEELDKIQNPIRMRLESTVIQVQHIGPPEKAELVSIVYGKGDKTFLVKAKKVVMASGGWINRHVVKDLPVSHRDAYEKFCHAPFLVANVAVTNWRFIERLGTGACMWSEGIFGNSCNIRLPMLVGGASREIDPDKPAVLTFYVSYESPGLPPKAQGAKGRWELFSTSYAEFERRIRAQLVELFSATGFDPRNDIAGIVLNRWGHAYVAPQPGFFFGVGDEASPREIIASSFGRISIGHAELEGLQHWGPAADQGKRAVRQLAEKFQAKTNG